MHDFPQLRSSVDPLVSFRPTTTNVLSPKLFVGVFAAFTFPNNKGRFYAEVRGKGYSRLILICLALIKRGFPFDVGKMHEKAPFVC
jgi:hypothetical protein